MGVASVLGLEPLRAAVDLVGNIEDQDRRRKAHTRISLYQDDCVATLRAEVTNSFRSVEVRTRLEPFLSMACSESIFKRIVDEIARPVYSVAPTRRVMPETEQIAFGNLVAECRLNQKMDLAVRLVHAANHVWLYYRFVERLGRCVLEVLTPDMVSVIPDPDDPTIELAIIYDSMRSGMKVHVYWDDEVTFSFTPDGLLVDSPVAHGLPRMPFVSIHRRERWGTYWDTTSGNDLVSAQIAVSWLRALSLKLLKSQGEKQLVVEGDTHGMKAPQVLDGESAIVAPAETTITSLDLRSDADHYNNTLDAIVTRVAANHGLSRDRINAKGVEVANDEGLLERRFDAIQTFWHAEQDGFEVLKMISTAHPMWTLDPDAVLGVDFGELEARVDLKQRLEIWQEMERMGLRNRLDDVRALNPEFQTDEQALAEYIRNLNVRQQRIELERRLNLPADGDSGRTPEENGRLGPQVRDNGPNGTPGRVEEMQ